MSTTTTGGGAAVRTVALTKTYGRHRGLDHLDLEVRTGEVLGFIGPNGAGKSTTIRLLLDLLRPTSGTVEVLGQDPRLGGAALRRRIGYLAGDLVLPERMTGRTVCDLMLTLSGAGRDARARARVEELAERLGLDLSRPTRTLSKGNRQKVGLVQAFAHEPELLVLDEPTSGLDPLVQQTFHSLVREAAAAGATVLMSSHVISEVEQTADRVAVLREGRLVALAGVDELRARSSRHVEVEIASPASPEPARASASLPTVPPVVADVAAALGLDDACAVPGQHGGLRVAGVSAATADELLRRLERAPWRPDLCDLVVDAPDLEDAVLRFYSQEVPA